MSFTTAPKAGPSLVESGAPSLAKAQEARERAISLLTNNQSQAQVSQTPPEVRQAQTLKPEGQIDSSEAVSESAASPSTPTEAAAAETQAPPKKEEPLSSQYAVLARKEKQLRVKAQQQEMAFKQREDSLRQREIELSQKDNSYKSDYIDKKRLSEDPMAVLAEAGLSYEQITQAVLNQPQVDPGTRALINELKNELKAIRGEQDNAKKSFSEQQSQSYQQAVKQIELEARTLVKDDPAFETIRETGSISDVVDLIKKTFDQDGILLSVEEAARAVEDELVEEAMKITRIKKIQQKLTSASEPALKQQGNGSKQAPQMKTLTNAVGTSRQLSARERAILAMEGKLSK